MSLRGLQERLAALQETTTQLKELLERLANFRFQPGAVPLSVEEEGSVSGELSAEIGLILRHALEDQQLLCEEVKYLRPDEYEKLRLEDGVERVGSELASYRSVLRKARLSARKSLEQAQRLEKELMVQSFAEPLSESATPAAEEEEALTIPRVPRHNHHQTLRSSLSEDDRQTVGASSNVTNALRRTHALIAAELTRSEFAHQTLTESSDALKQLDDSYSTLDSMLARSRDLLATLLKSQKSDTWYLQTAFYMLLATGAWLVFKRLLYGPMWWLVWLPLRLVFGVGTKAGRAIMQRRGGPGESGEAGVVIDGNINVRGLPDDSLPTAWVGSDSTPARDESDPNSMIEKIGKIVDAANEADELGSISNDETDMSNDKENAMKWEAYEVQEAVEYSRLRDEV